VISFTAQSLYSQEKRLCYPMDRRLCESQSQSGCSGEEKNSKPLLGLKPPIIQPIAQYYTTELSWLIYQDNVTVS
jgi:hypothetical protein